MKSLCIAAVVAWTLPAAWAATTIADVHPHAYGANVGWIDARGDGTNGAAIGSFYCSGYAWSANCGWLNLGNGPTNGWHYSNAAADWGVNHDGQGLLSGYAYGANIGWILFEQSQGQPRVDLLTGNLSGHVWGANVGWISLSNAQAFVRTETLAPGPDTDDDHVPDAWEMKRAGNLDDLGGSYPDGDGVPDVEEYAADTDPLTGEHLEIVSLARTPGTNALAWTSRPTRLYRVEATNILGSIPGEWEDVGGGLLGPPPESPAQAVFPDAAPAPAYVRVKAVVPLSE